MTYLDVNEANKEHARFLDCSFVYFNFNYQYVAIYAQNSTYWWKYDWNSKHQKYVTYRRLLFPKRFFFQKIFLNCFMC